MKLRLLDTGPSVAYLDGADPALDDVTEDVERFTGRFVAAAPPSDEPRGS